MITILSPAKRLLENPIEGEQYTQPELLDETKILVEKLKGLDVHEIKDLMGVSESIAQLNHMRFRNFKIPLTGGNSFPALLGFQGDVYQNMQTDEYQSDDFEFAQKHLRILSGLYGVLRPLDRIFPYRLEMGTSLQNERGKDLYQFWGSRITDIISADLEGQREKILVNLASSEYFRSIKLDELRGQLLNIHFKQWRGGKLKVIGLMAKRARGMMADFIIRNRIEHAEDLHAFQEGGYRFTQELSSERDWVYVCG